MQVGYAYFDNGLSFRSSPGGSDLNPGDVFFLTTPTSQQLTDAFPGYTASVAKQQALAQYGAAVASGLTLNWSVTTTLSGTYAIDQVTQGYVNSEMVCILKYSVFTNKQTTRVWPDASGAYHTFSTDQFSTFAAEIGLYIDQLIAASQAALAGQTPTWPSSTVTINA